MTLGKAAAPEYKHTEYKCSRIDWFARMPLFVVLFLKYLRHYKRRVDATLNAKKAFKTSCAV
jgi:hypothetical protein